MELDEPRGEIVAGGHLALGLEHSVVADLLEHAVTTRCQRDLVRQIPELS